MKHQLIVAALVVASMQLSRANAATALEYNVRAQLPRGEHIAATVTVNGRRPDVTGAQGRQIGAVLDAFNAANAVVAAAVTGKRDARIMFGPGRTCVDLHIETQGDSITATGTVDAPAPPPGDQQQPPPPGGKLDVRIVATLDHRQLARARGDFSPENAGRGPHVTWTVEKVGN